MVEARAEVDDVHVKADLERNRDRQPEQEDAE
jgi:hypothetical protein